MKLFSRDHSGQLNFHFIHVTSTSVCIEAVIYLYVCLENVVPGQPIDVATRTFTDSVFVSWKAPEGGAIVRGYVIGYGEGVPDVSWQYLDANRRNVTIRNLSMKSAHLYRN